MTILFDYNKIGERNSIAEKEGQNFSYLALLAKAPGVSRATLCQYVKETESPT